MCLPYTNRAHQAHYEQFGRLTGTINIDKYNPVELAVVGMRDHSYGEPA